MKFILSEHKKFVLEEKLSLNEKMDATEYPNIIKFYPNAAIKDSSWTELKLPDVSKFDKSMKKDLEEYFGAKWITVEQCNELIKTAAKNKPNGDNFSETKALFNKFKKEYEEKNNNSIEIATEWAELYKLCGKASDKQKAFKAFWNGGLPLKNEANPDNLPIAANTKFNLGYYKGEWGEQGELVRSFGSHFTNLLSEHGWTATLNPFIDFLKYLFTLKNIMINDASFAHIVEAFNIGLISIKDLRGKGILEKFNLIFNPSLYADSTSIIEYLKGQSTAIKWANNLPADSNLKTVFMNIAAKDGNSSNLNDSKILGTITANSYNYTIRPLTTYKELIKTTFDPDDEENEIIKDATDKQISSITNSINTQDKAKKFLAYLISVCRIMDNNLADKINKKFNNKLISNRNTTQTTFEDEVAFDKILNRSTTKYSREQLEKIITEVIKIAKI